MVYWRRDILSGTVLGTVVSRGADVVAEKKRRRKGWSECVVLVRLMTAADFAAGLPVVHDPVNSLSELNTEISAGQKRPRPFLSIFHDSELNSTLPSPALSTQLLDRSSCIAGVMYHRCKTKLKMSFLVKDTKRMIAKIESITQMR